MKKKIACLIWKYIWCLNNKNKKKFNTTKLTIYTLKLKIVNLYKNRNLSRYIVKFLNKLKIVNYSKRYNKYPIEKFVIMKK